MDVFSCSSPAYLPPVRGSYYTPSARADAMAGRPATTTESYPSSPSGPGLDLSYVLCINSKTASGVEGHDYLPGHNNLSIFINDDSQMASNPMLQTLGKWPDLERSWLAHALDNVVPDNDATDVILNSPYDAPDPATYPFSYCKPMTADGYDRLMDFAALNGDFQLWGKACTSFAMDGFNVATDSSVFGNRGLVATPSDLGAQIIALNGGESRAPNLWGTTFNTGERLVGSGVDAARDTASEWWGSMSPGASEAWDGISSGAESARNSAGDAASSAWSEISSWF